MKIKAVQWNIGGGKIRRSGDDPDDPLSYSFDALDAIIETLCKYNPDIVTLQECHSNETLNQVERIAKALKLPYWVSDVYDESHLEKGWNLTQGVISRLPLSNHQFELFLNPKLETMGPRGERWTSHDKGVTSCVMDLPGVKVEVKTSHSLPFRKFHTDPLSKECALLRNDMEEKLMPKEGTLLFQGDLNYDERSVGDFLSKIFASGVREVILDTPTTPKDRWYDHILYRGLTHRRSNVDTSVRTDHYPIVSEFEIVHPYEGDKGDERE